MQFALESADIDRVIRVPPLFLSPTTISRKNRSA
jgi:hypothetical protein